MKKLAAHDFEDLLQCSIPTFEDLLDGPHNKCLMKLLYRTAEWHMLAKLRMHGLNIGALGDAHQRIRFSYAAVPRSHLFKV
jgi:hypothetical protein